MKVFLDANVLISVLNHELPVYTFSSRLLSLSGSSGLSLYTSTVCMAIAFYFASKKSGAKKAKEKIKVLSKHIPCIPVEQAHLDQALSDRKVLDLEDGIQYYSALNSKIDYIVTENQSDFHFSKIPVFSSEGFLKQVWIKKIKSEKS